MSISEKQVADLNKRMRDKKQDLLQLFSGSSGSHASDSLVRALGAPSFGQSLYNVAQILGPPFYEPHGLGNLSSCNRFTQTHAPICTVLRECARTGDYTNHVHHRE